MRFLTFSLVAVFAAIPANVVFGQIKAEFVSTRKIWEEQKPISDSDLARFQGNRYCALQTGAMSYSADAEIRLLRSADGVEWKSVKAFKSQTKGHGFRAPKLVVTPNGQLMLTAMGTTLIHQPNTTYDKEHLMVWTSKNGRDWEGPATTGRSDFLVSSVLEHDGKIYTYGRGCICGIAQTVEVRSSKKGKLFEQTYKETVSGYFPKAASLVFKDKTGYCFMNRGKSALVGISKSPYNDWTWSPLNMPVRRTNAVRLDDGQILVSTRLSDEHVRTSLCWFDEEKQNLLEILELSSDKHEAVAGLSAFDGHLFASYPGEKDEKTEKYTLVLTKVKAAKPR